MFFDGFSKSGAWDQQGMLPFWSLLLSQCPWRYNARPLPGRCLLFPIQSHQPLWPFIAFRAEVTCLCPLSPHLMTLSQQPSACSACFWFCPVQMHSPTTEYVFWRTVVLPGWSPGILCLPQQLSGPPSHFSLLPPCQAYRYHKGLVMSMCSIALPGFLNPIFTGYP